MDRRQWLGSRKTGLTLWQESRAKAGVSAEESCLHKRVEKLGDVQSVSDQDRDPIRGVASFNVVEYRGFGAPEEIRTPDPQIRSLVLYPAELRARFSLGIWA